MNSPYLIVPIVAWVVGQVAKFAIHALKGDVSGRYLYSSGGMPSTHSAMVGALAVVALLEGGFSSPGFGISIVLLIIVMVDAMNVRRAVGENRQAIKTLYNLVPLAKKRTKDDDALESSQALGHTPVEVLSGVVLGSVTAYSLLYSRAANSGWGLLSRPVGTEQIVYRFIFGAMLLLGVILIIAASRGVARRLSTGRSLRASFRQALIFPGVTGLFLLWAQDQAIDVISRRWLVWLTLLVSVILLLMYSARLYDGLRDKFTADLAERESRKKKRKKRRRKG